MLAVLPPGVALVRIATPRLVVVSVALTRDQALAARILACVGRDAPYVMVTVSEVMAVMEDAA